MKRIWGIITGALIFGLALSGCGNPVNGGGSLVPKTVTITGLPPQDYSNGNLIQIGLFRTLDNINIFDTPEIYAEGNIQNGAVTANLITGKDNLPWNGTGSWYVILLVENENSPVGADIRVNRSSVNFNANAVSIPWSSFTKYALEIGELSGAITLTGISNPPPRVRIEVKGYGDGGGWDSFAAISLSGVAGSTATLNWTIPVYEDFIPGSECEFRLYVQPGDAANGADSGVSIRIPGTKTINTANDLNINLGTADIAVITLSGTINITYDLQTVHHVGIDAYAVTDHWNWIGSTEFRLLGDSASWSITTLPLSTMSDIHFSVNGYDSNGNSLFRNDLENPVVQNVQNQNVSGIILNVWREITLSGTISVTFDGQTVPDVRITAYAENENHYWNRVGSTDLISPGNNAPWSITMPALNTPSNIRFSVRGDAYGNRLFDKELETPVVPNVQNQNVSNIVINVGDIQIITLSGTISVTYDGETVYNVWITAYAGNEDAWDTFGDTLLSSPEDNAAWSITGYPLITKSNIRFSVRGSVPAGHLLFEKELETVVPNVQNQNVNDIVLNVGDIPSPFSQMPSNPLVLTADTWVNGEITTPVIDDWYAMTVEDGSIYYLWWNDADNSMDKTLDISVQAYYGDGTLIFDQNVPNEYGFFAYSSGTVYVRVYPGSMDNTGTYGIAYNTTWSKPSP